MKNIFLAVTICFCFGINAQTKTNNFGFGLSPFGMMNVKMEFEQNSNTEEMKIDYKSYLNAHLFYERQFGGAGLLIEATYAMSKFNEVDKNILNFYEPEALYDKDITVYSAAFYGSYAINKQKRLQIPLYLGVGLDYVNGQPVDIAFISLAAKARLKFYISNKIALYGGFNYKTGLGLESSDDDTGGKPKRTTKLNQTYSDLGITFSF